MSVTNEQYSMGWVPDYPDFRDYCAETPGVAEPLEKGIMKAGPDLGLPKRVDLSYWCSPVEHQQSLGSCTANAGAGMIEYYQRKAFGEHVDISRLFLYKVTRNFLNWKGDKGAYLRTTMKAIALMGIPPESYWPYEIDKFDEEPTAFCYAFAQNYKAVNYYRVDSQGKDRQQLLKDIKTSISAGYPLMFGFSVYSSISQANSTGKIPFPTLKDSYRGGHAVMCVGYDDDIRIKNNGILSNETVGAFKIRNSWGKEWGESGYGWLPYEYVMKNIAVDWWALIDMKWVDTGQFGDQFMNSVEMSLPDKDVIERLYASGNKTAKINVPGLGEVEGEIGECPNSACKKKTCIKGTIDKWIFRIRFEYCPSCGHLKIYSPLGSMEAIKSGEELPETFHEFPILAPALLSGEAAAIPDAAGISIKTKDGLPISGTLVQCPRCNKLTAIQGTIKLGFLNANAIYCPACGFLKIYFG